MSEPSSLEPDSRTREQASISFTKRHNTDDKIAFKSSTPGMMVPHKSPGEKDNDSLVSGQSIGSQMTQKIRQHTQVQTTCQHCGENIMTNVIHRKTYFTYMCTLLLMPCCLCFIPHVFKKFQQPIHHCPICSQTVKEQILSADKTLAD
ncbi:uncharacterized protein LOC134820837 [Bolinopsis microptera]|uniref:uncharacterized protein LOC134820837 n=1 Tax=Bolinopsis microptera TaxID=2820187 RepID=UPI0030796C83